jgi:polygalacturonase
MKPSYYAASTALVLLAMTQAGHAQSRTCDVKVYGATNDGHNDNAVHIQTAIDDCARMGGGIVRIGGGGTYVTGPISLRSHIHLQIDAGTTLKNTNDHSKYQPAFIGYPFQFKNSPAQSGAGPNLPGLPEAMISAANVTDVGIMGSGTIDGSGNDPAADGGPSWWQLAANAKSNPSPTGFYVDNYNPQGYSDIPSSNGQPRPWTIEFYNATQVVINGITVTNSPMWCLGLRYVTGAQITNYKVVNPSDSPNTDGIDPVGAQNVTMANLDINTGDDNVAIKSGLPGIPADAYYHPPYNLPRIPTSNITIMNSVFRRGHGLSVGSETYNGVNTIRASNITFLGTDNGFRIKTGRDRGNQIYGMNMSNLTMTDVPTPLSLSDYYPTVPTASQGDITQTTTAEPYMHDITISYLTATNPGTVRATNTTGGLILGLPESPIYNLNLSHIHINAARATTIRIRNVKNSSCTDVVVSPATGGKNFTIDPGAPNSVANSPGCTS